MENGDHSITSAYNGLALDVWEQSTKARAEIRQANYSGAKNQQWLFQATALGAVTTNVAASATNVSCVDSSDITPSDLSDTGASGPFNVRLKNVRSWSARGFGGGTIW